MSKSEHIPAAAFPPGSYIRDELEARGLTVEELAKWMDKPVPWTECLIKGEVPVLICDAQRLSQLFGMDAMTWLHLECAWRTATPEQREAGKSDG